MSNATGGALVARGADPQRKGKLFETREFLKIQISSTDDAIRRLAALLTPLLKPPVPQNTSDAKQLPTSNSEFVDILQNDANAVWNLKEMVSDLIDRLDI